MKIVFITFHNWETRRIGGFHKFAEAASIAGHEVVFFSFARPYFIAFKHSERLNKNVLKTLGEGKTYEVDKKGHLLTNCTWPTLRIPQPLHKFVPYRINHWFQTHSLTPFRKIQQKYFDRTDVFVFESCEGVELLNLVKKYNPLARIVYRPSDPLMIDGCGAVEQNLEEQLMLAADINLIVNKCSEKLYEAKINRFKNRVKYQILPNGVNTNLFEREYDKPIELQKVNTFLYVGARRIEWNLIRKAADLRSSYNFIIVCPEIPPKDFDRVKNNNITYVPGIPPSEVPAWVTNCDVVIVPNPKGMYKIKPWGITAKYYQAMAAQKPIVAFDDTTELKEHGIYVSYDYDSFISQLDLALNDRCKKYDFKGMEWGEVTTRFLRILSELYNHD